MTGIKRIVDGASASAALPWAFLVGGFALYGLGAARGLSILDSGEFLGVAATLGVAHPTGYPLYALLGQLATLFPAGDPAFLVNLVSAAAGAGAAFFLALAAGEAARQLEVRPAARLAAMAAAGLLALTARTLWSVSTLAEVYALNACLWAAILWAALRLRRTGAPRELYVLALLSGLALANHLTTATFLPAAAVVGWPGRARARELARALPLAAVIFLAGVSLNLYTPLRAAQKPLFNWNDPSALRYFYAHVTGVQYRGLLAGGTAATFKAALAEYGASAPFNAGVAAPFAAAALVWLFVKRYRAVALALLLYYAAYLAYCAFYAVQDIYYFFIPLHLAVGFLGALGLAAVADLLGRGRGAPRAAAAAVVWAAIVAAGGWAVASNFPHGYRRAFSFAERYGRRLLQALPAKALVFSSGDTTGNVTWYNLYVRRLRPDVAVADQVRLANRGYLTSLARRHADLIVPAEAEVGALAAEAFARGTFDQANVVMEHSDDFILPQVIENVITCNASRRRIFWGLGDPGAKLEAHLVPYGLVLEAVLEEPPRAEVTRRAEEAVAAWNGLLASVREAAPAELRDETFRDHAALYYMGLSDHLAARRRYEAQLALLESYVGLFPDDAGGFENLAHVYAVTGRPEEAADNYRRALALAPENVALRSRLLKALAAAGRDDEVAALAAEGGEEAGEGDYFRAIAYREAGDIDKALAAFEAAEAYCADDAEYWLELGVTYDAAGDYEASARAFSRALELNPERPWLYTARGVEKLKLGEEAAAAADFEAALELNAGEAQAHYNLACLYARQGRTAEALEQVEAAVRLEPEHYLPLAREDEDLASCRDEPAFARLVAEYGGVSAP
ncbi:MAG: DUF2723 domain-containing protein [Candidatus Coatesbacteria bacterium]|nr:MAG: DUF2723 domain-containing protein [Candidatus Coatesbacteria bacterium]